MQLVISHTSDNKRLEYLMSSPMWLKDFAAYSTLCCAVYCSLCHMGCSGSQTSLLISWHIAWIATVKLANTCFIIYTHVSFNIVCVEFLLWLSLKWLVMMWKVDLYNVETFLLILNWWKRRQKEKKTYQWGRFSCSGYVPVWPVCAQSRWPESGRLRGSKATRQLVSYRWLLHHEEA